MKIVDTNAIAERLGVKPGTVHKWRRRNLEFPPPIASLDIGPVWDYADVARWAEERRTQRTRLIAR